MTPLEQLDIRGLHVLDGGLATELERRGLRLDGPLWSAQLIESSPETIAAVHRDYLEAGADCLLTASYQVSREGFEEIGFGRERAAQAAEAMLRTSVALAVEATRVYQSASPRKVWIAASLGSYGAMLHNGAEFHGNYDCSFEDMVQFHRRRIAVVRETKADFLAFESVPCLAEAQAIVAALEPFPEVGAYISFTCRDGLHTSHGERLQACGTLLDQVSQIIGVGVNCTSPELIRSLVFELSQATRKPVIVYPNSGELWDAVHRCWLGDGQIQQFGALARAWRAAGAQVIGGCCRTGPEHIRAVVEAWREEYPLQ